MKPCFWPVSVLTALQGRSVWLVTSASRRKPGSQGPAATSRSGATATAATEIFAEDPLVEVLAADWSTLLDRGPYSLLFLDSGQPGEVGVDAIADLVEDGGIVVLDDFTPCEQWPPITYGRVDTLREQWLTDERFTAVEVMVAPDASTIIATKR